MIFKNIIKPRIVCNYKKDGEDGIQGYGIGIFMTYKNLLKEEYISRIVYAVNLLKTEDTKNLIIEKIHTLDKEDIQEIERKCGLKVLDGKNEMITSIAYIIKYIYRLIDNSLNEKEILIISDDTCCTEKVAIQIANESNFVSVISDNKIFSEKLRREVLNETGLSLQLIKNLDKTIQNYDVIINMSCDYVFIYPNKIKRRAIVIDASIGRKFEKSIGVTRKDLLIVTDFIYKNLCLLKSFPEGFGYDKEIYSYINEGIRTNCNTKPIGIRVNNKNYTIKEVVEIYYGKKRNLSLFLTK